MYSVPFDFTGACMKYVQLFRQEMTANYQQIL